MKKKILYISSIIYILLTSFTYSEVIEVSNSQLKSLLENNVPIIDIRREEEWKATGIIENSILMTFFDKKGKPNTNDWLNKLNQIASKKDPIVLICRTGRRTGIVAKFLSEKLGYKSIYDVTDGITEWLKEGNIVVKPIIN